jgi:hypothetical protein
MSTSPGILTVDGQTTTTPNAHVTVRGVTDATIE